MPLPLHAESEIDVGKSPENTLICGEIVYLDVGISLKSFNTEFDTYA